MITNQRHIFLMMFIWGLLTQPLMAQEDILKAYAEVHNERKFCFYPSTLRMLNLAQDPGFYELIEPVEKLLFYKLDSSSTASRSFREVMKTYQKAGYEEYAQVYGGDYDVYILGKERDVLEWVGIVKQGNDAFAFYLTGPVNWQKIPQLTQTLQQNEMLELLDLIPDKKNKRSD